MKKLATLGRILFALPFFVFALLDFTNAAILSGYVPAYFPGGALWVYVVGFIFLITSIMITFDTYTYGAFLILGILLSIIVLLVNLPQMWQAMSFTKLIPRSTGDIGALFQNFYRWVQLVLSLPPIAILLETASLAGAAFYCAAMNKGSKSRTTTPSPTPQV